MTQQAVVSLALDDLLICEPSKRHNDPNMIARLSFNLDSTPQINPLLVRPMPESDKYGIITGTMRALALRKAKKTHAACIVVDKELSEAEVLELVVSENLQRFDPDAMEFSHRICRYMEASGLNGPETARKLGVSVTEVSRCRERVFEWVEALQLLVERGTIAPSTGHAIHKIEDPVRKQEAMRLAAEGKLTRDAAFSWAQESKNGRPPARKAKASRVKVALEQGAVTVAGRELSPERVVALLREALKRARKAMSRGGGDAFLAALRETSVAKKSQRSGGSIRRPLSERA